jgi:hypothetical protein
MAERAGEESPRMIWFTILSTLCGAALGFRFRFPALAPALVGNLIIVVGGGLIVGMDLARIALDFVVATVVLQLGFFVGAGARVSVARLAASRQPVRPHAPRAVQ